MSERIDLVIGTRPNIVKAGPLFRILQQQAWCEPRLVFLAQHTQDEMTTHSLEDVGIRIEDAVRIDLEQRTPGQRMGEMIDRYSVLLDRAPPTIVTVFGDVDSTLAAAYAAKRMQVPVAHVEAGLRSRDMTMPEELNRLMVDSIADLLMTTTESASRNLLAEGRAPDSIHCTGNLMIDSLLQIQERPDWSMLKRSLRTEYVPTDDPYAIATFHRPSNVDARAHLVQVAELLERASRKVTVLFPVHPRSRAAFERHNIAIPPRVRVLPPLRYAHFIALLAGARMVLTDSGGIQEETSVLGIPCVTFRANTERPETLTLGTNRLASPSDAEVEIRSVMESPPPSPARIPLWDGQTAKRTAQVLQRWTMRDAA